MIGGESKREGLNWHSVIDIMMRCGPLSHMEFQNEELRSLGENQGDRII